ncbi:MAG: hypothetical protein M0Z41_14665 [Peptococcaceae bacterium]|nr:hypothetical protein [Peptococcaceae bacterium]
MFAYAVRSGEESFRFSTALAEKAPFFNTRRVLHALAADEEEHRRILGMILGDGKAPAERRETADREPYEGMAARYPPGYIRRWLEQMAAMEKGHRHKEEILLNLRSGEFW